MWSLVGAVHVERTSTTSSTAPRRTSPTAAATQVIVDIGGNPGLARLRLGLSPDGTVVITGGETCGRWLGGTTGRSGRGCCPRATAAADHLRQPGGPRRLVELVDPVEVGSSTPAIERTFPFARRSKAVNNV